MATAHQLLEREQTHHLYGESTKTCPACQQQHPPEEQFCVHCGAPLTNGRKAIMKAIEIGTDIDTQSPVYLPEQDRTYHTGIVGQTRFGKSELLKRMALEDIKNDINAVLFDPHGDLTEDLLLQAASAGKADKVLLYEITAESTYSFNPVEVKNPDDPMEVSRTVDSLMQVFRKHWSSIYAWGPRVEWVLSNCIRTIVANPGYTLAEIPLLLRDDGFRSYLLPNVTNPQVHDFWNWYRTLESTCRLT